MRAVNQNHHDDEHRHALWQAIMQLKTPDECRRFFVDLCTPGEIADFTERWHIARLLDKGDQSYRDIAETTGASTTTVGRVARFLSQEGYQGYRMVLDRLKKAKKR
jgi:TrpR-related protein YerC/YecD